MTNYSFSKAFLQFQEVLIVYEEGDIRKPICILTDYDIKYLNKEWKKKAKEFDVVQNLKKPKEAKNK